MEKKLTVAKKNEMLRNQVIERIFKEGIINTELLQVAGSKFMINADFEGEKVPVRVDIVVPKISEDDTNQFAEDFADEYQQKLKDKAEEKAEKEKAKAKKIERDKKRREQAKNKAE